MSIEVTVVGGYLGSGKTTLLNHLLRTATERLVVLVNDFGDINLDAELVAAEDDDMIELANGCICCSLADGFVAAIEQVSAIEPAPDRLVIEASGVADPAQVAAYGHSAGFHLGAVIVLADGGAVREQANDRFIGTTVLRQLVGADVAVVTKTDLLDGRSIDEVTAWVAAAAPDALVVESGLQPVGAEVLFGPSLRPRNGEAATHDSAGAADPLVLAEHQGWSHRWTGLVQRSSVDRMLEQLPAEVTRLKGIVWCVDEAGAEPRPWLVQRAGRRHSVVPWLDRSDPTSRVVCIGEPDAIDDDWLAARLG